MIAQWARDWLRFPRPRGDRPDTVQPLKRQTWLPPPTRGSTFVGFRSGFRIAASPAHAGIDPWLRWRSLRRSGFPRPRGDRPAATSGLESAVSLPPPTRGSTCRISTLAADVRASPAHAGIDPCSTPRRLAGNGFPRPRGDRPFLDAVCQAAERLPPPTRGSTCDLPPLLPRTVASPAHAGIDPMPLMSPCSSPSFPRPRGDRPTAFFGLRNRVLLPPPTRGSTLARGLE